MLALLAVAPPLHGGCVGVLEFQPSPSTGRYSNLAARATGRSCRANAQSIATITSDALMTADADCPLASLSSSTASLVIEAVTTELRYRCQRAWSSALSLPQRFFVAVGRHPVHKAGDCSAKARPQCTRLDPGAALRPQTAQSFDCLDAASPSRIHSSACLRSISRAKGSSVFSAAWRQSLAWCSHNSTCDDIGPTSCGHLMPA
jgi:hypothetical protein